MQKNVAYTIPKLTDYSAAALEKAAAELLSASDQEWQEVRNEADWKALRDRWMARKNGILTLVNDLWLKPAPKEAKRDVGQRVNEIKAQVERDVEKGRGLAKNYPILHECFHPLSTSLSLDSAGPSARSIRLSRLRTRWLGYFRNSAIP